MSSLLNAKRGCRELTAETLPGKQGRMVVLQLEMGKAELLDVLELF